MSAWIESHQSLRQHPKTARLAKRLGASIPHAIGHLHCLWWWAMDYAEDGDLADFDSEEIAIGAGWDGDPDTFVAAAAVAGFLDVKNGSSTFIIHDWYEYIGKLLERREKDRKRKAAARREPVRRPSAGSLSDGARTEPNRTEPNRTEPNQDLTPLAVASATTIAIDSDFEVWWEAYHRVGTKASAKDCYRWWRKSGKASADDLLTAALSYRAHCEAVDCKVMHGSTFLAKSTEFKSARWPEWLTGEAHGSMDVRGDRDVMDVLETLTDGFGLDGDEDEHRPTTIDSRTTRVVEGGQEPRRRIPPRQLERGE